MSVRDRPAVSVICPTHRTAPENRQDPIRLRGLIAQAGDRLSAALPEEESAALMDRLAELERRIDYQHTREGVGLFVAGGTAELVQFPVEVQPRVSVRDGFPPLPLVAALNRSTRYRVLVLSEKPTRLYEGQWDQLAEVEDDRFPLAHEGPGGAEPLPGGHGVNASAYRDEKHRQFFREVDARLAVVHRREPLPLLIAGVQRYHAFFREVTQHGDWIVGAITGSHDRTSAGELGRLAWPVVRGRLEERDRARLEELERAVGADRYASAIDQVWRSAREQRGAVLFVEEGFRYPARATEDGASLRDVSAASEVDASDDITAEIVRHVLDAGGEVVVLPGGTLDAHQGIALVLRY